MLPLPSPLLTVSGAAPAAWHTVRTQDTLSQDSTGWSGWTGRQQVLASSLTDVSATQLRISWKAGSTQLKIAKAYIGLQGTGQFDFSTTPTQILFSGGSSILISSGNTGVSDAVTFSYDGTSNLVISTYHDATASYASSNSILRGQCWQKAGDDAATVTPTGGGTGSAMDIIALIEAFY